MIEKEQHLWDFTRVASIGKSKIATFLVVLCLFHTSNTAAFPGPKSLRNGFQSIKVSLSGASTANVQQRFLIRGISTGRSAYVAPNVGNTNDRIRRLLELAQSRNDISIADMARLGAAYRTLGDDASSLLAHCLNTTCNHAYFVVNQQRSSLHRRMSWELPHLSPSAINHKVGELNERVMNIYYTSTGWRQIPGEVGRSGIDGLFVKYRRDGGIREVLVSESKYNFSQLGNTQSGRQMSQQWTLRKIDNLFEANRDPVYLEVRRLVEQGNYRSILWRLMPSADKNSVFVIQRQRVRDDGGVLAFDDIRGGYRMLVDRVANQTIDLDLTSNAFQNVMASNIQRAFQDIVAEEYSKVAR